MEVPPRILIVTAAFGEGHNSAARNLATAFTALGVENQVADPCVLAAPRATAAVNRGYRYVTTHFPALWGEIYRSTDRCDLGKQRSKPLRMVEDALAKRIAEFKPTALVSTYPLYPYLMTHLAAERGMRLPVFIVVTDSIEINAAWTRADGTAWLVTDPATREAMLARGLPAGKLVDTGFPVSPVFRDLQPVPANDPCDPFRILVFPTSQPALLRRQGRALLEASPRVRLTMVLGRNVRSLYPAARELKDAFPGRVKLVGWTRRVPQFLSDHHLVVGKAGGATVHEAIAACCPMLIHHLVPGQEEGNLRLLEKIGAGHLAESADALAAGVRSLLAGDAAGWRAMKQALVRHGRNAGAVTAAGFILNRLAEGGSTIGD